VKFHDAALQAENQRDEAAAAAALLQQKGQYLEQEAFKEVHILTDRIQQLMAALSKVAGERDHIKAEFAAQNLMMEELRKEFTALRAERGALKAQNSTLGIRVAEFHDEMKSMRRDSCRPAPTCRRLRTIPPPCSRTRRSSR
jgi:chromosome segregation ATPase